MGDNDVGTPETIIPEPDSKQWPHNSPNFDFSIDKDDVDLKKLSYTAPTKPDTLLSDLPTHGYEPDPKVNTGEDYRRGKLFEWAHANLHDADDYVAGDVPKTLDAINIGLQQAVQDFKDGLTKLDSGTDPWKGKTRNAVQHNVYESFHIPESVAAGAGALSILNDAFSRTLGTAKNDIVSNWNGYVKARDFAYWSVPDQDLVQHRYNSFARNVIQHIYNPNIKKVAEGNPGFNTGSPPPVAGANAPPGGPGLGPGGPGLGPGGPGSGSPGLGSEPDLGGGGGPGEPVGGAGVPRMPNLADQVNTPIGPTTPPTGNGPETAPPTSDPAALSGLAMPAQAAMAPAQSLGQLASMAGQAGNPGIRNATNGLGRPPREGALNLGPKSAKGGAGGIGGGAGARSPAIGKPAGAPSTATGTLAGRTMAAGSRAGLSATGGPATGAPGAGAPTAGHQGAAQGAQYQPSKMLRRKKNGEKLIGEAEAVVAVLGEPTRSEAAKPET